MSLTERFANTHRPALSEQWHRIAHETPALLSHLHISRSVAFGETWHIIEHPGTNAFFRVNAPAYRFLTMLDGHRSVDDAWRQVSERLGDEAPTQGEAIRLLSQLHEAELLRTDAETRVEPVLRRTALRRRREVRSQLGGLLFVRVPLFNPDRLLQALAPWCAPLVSPLGLFVWLLVVFAGLWQFVGDAPRFLRASGEVLSTGNLLTLYVVFACIKAGHEMGHGLMLKVLSRPYGGAGVYRVGVLLMLFLPFPYIDASSAWKLRSKWHRAMVGLAGMIVELLIAAIGAIVWVRAGEGTALSAISYNVVLAAGLSTLLFNANPLLRYDGYHVLSDVLEVPNLASRATQHVQSWVKRVCFGVRGAAGFASTRREAWLFTVYAVASILYRFFIYGAIALFVLDQQFALGMVILLVACVELVLTPVWRGVSYLVSSPELSTRRSRAAWVTVSVVGAVLLPVLLVPLPRNATMRGVIEPASFLAVHAEIDGALQGLAPTGAWVEAGERVLSIERLDLEYEAERLAREKKRLDLIRRASLRDDPAALNEIDSRMVVIEEQLRLVRGRLAAGNVVAERPARWIRDGVERRDGAYVHAGEPLGILLIDEAHYARVEITPAIPGGVERAGAVCVRAAGMAAAEYGATYVRLESAPVDEGTTGTDRHTAHILYAIDGAAPWSLGQEIYVRARIENATIAERLFDGVLRVFQQRGVG